MEILCIFVYGLEMEWNYQKVNRKYGVLLILLFPVYRIVSRVYCWNERMFSTMN